MPHYDVKPAALDRLFFTLELVMFAFKASPSVNSIMITGFVRQRIHVVMPNDIRDLLVDFVCIPREFTRTHNDDSEPQDDKQRRAQKKRSEDLARQIEKTRDVLTYMLGRNSQVSVISEYMSGCNEHGIGHIHANTADT